MGSFDQNFQSLVGLKKEKLAQEANQQQFNQNEAFFRRAGDLEAQKLGNQKSQFELDRAKGFMPHELRMAGIQGDAASQSLYDQKQQSDFGAEMNRFDLQGRSMDMQDRAALSGRRNADWNYEDQNRAFDIRGRSMDMDDRISSRYGSGPSYSAPRLGSAFGGLGGSSGYSSPAITSSYNPVFSQPKPNPLRYANGGAVQDVQEKGFVPVQVSNGEYEFTPEQVANIGAAMLSSQAQTQSPAIGFGPVG